jgi:hypothetical protein
MFIDVDDTVTMVVDTCVDVVDTIVDIVAIGYWISLEQSKPFDAKGNY